MDVTSRWIGPVSRVVFFVAISCAGCASTRITDTARSGMEQLLVSNAVDASLDKVDFTSLSGAAVFVDEKHLECTDKKYIVGSIRQRVFRAGCRLVDKPDEADVVVELYSGGVGTDRSEGFIGTPALNVPGPIPVQVPEIKLVSQTTQYGTAKLGIVAYNAKTGHALSDGGLVRARSNNTNWTVLGVGPVNSGNIRDEMAMTKRSKDRQIALGGRGSRTASQQNSFQAIPLAHGAPYVPSSAATIPPQIPPNGMPLSGDARFHGMPGPGAWPPDGNHGWPAVRPPAP